MSDITPDEAEDRMRYVEPNSTRQEKHEAVGESFRRVAWELASVVPGSRQKSLMMTKLEEARMWANAAIAQCVE